ncbi:MAG TPA: M20/M25/M40 family metallo-hydrolase [Saprospiraceae bacterium]|nr:M20/M25/M40 family metallo-hydrolase [Saprospiraceae bacterium]HMP12544.1 M20/M25/M40 family metallo-hydrolase [Saprospiraceae bacterium]
MNRYTFHYFFIIFLFAVSVTAQPSPKAALHDLRVDVVYLASDLLQGREAGTDGEQLAAEYIATRFERIGLQPKGTKGSWFQEFDFQFNPNPHTTSGGENRMGKNVLGFLDNKAKTTIVIGAHYDHLGDGAFSSMSPNDRAIHNGADDNASGVAALLYLASYLKNQSKAKNNNYLFIAFSAEELGLIGSKHWVKQPTLDFKSINYMLNMDMVGRLNDEKTLVINGAGTSPAWKPALEQIKIGGIQIKTTDSGIGASDHTSFYLADVPALHFFTGQHSEYHKPSDDAPLINYDGLLLVSHYIATLIEALDAKGRLEFTKTKDESENRRAASFKVSLGVMPDYTYNGEGMRVDGVLEGRPGAKAGLEKGDIILQMGAHPVNDIYGYMEGLSKFKAGETAIIRVRRDTQVLELETTF